MDSILKVMVIEILFFASMGIEEGYTMTDVR